jgi:anti-sigma28 factor (negative regulator of flagellin synthesis)
LITQAFFLYGEITMRIKNVTSLAPSSERRQFGRIKISEPRICHVHMPKSQELWTDRAILMNISLGGIYFVCDRQPPLKKGDVRYLTFDTPYPNHENHHFGFHVLVVRTELRQLDPPQFAVALRILSDPIYYPLQETNKRDVTSFDKPRIMYQYYDLNKKAYEIITNTPEIRTEKIKNIKEFIMQGSYNVKSEKISQSVINDLFLENMLLPKM